MGNFPLGFELVANQDRQRLLDELKRTAVEALGNLPAELFAPIETRLRESIREVGGLQARTDLATVLGLRARSASFVMRFRELLARNFDDLRSRVGRDSHAAAMGLVEDSEIGFHIAAQNVADTIVRHFSRPLEMLEQRFESLSVGLGTPHAANPVSALRLVAAFQQAFAGAESSDSLRQLLFAEYEQLLLRDLGELYARLNALLAQDNVAIGQRRSASPPKVSADIEAFRAPAETRVEFQRMREHLHAWRGGVATVAQPGVVREFRPEELAGIAASVQQEPVPDYVRSLAGDARLDESIRSHLLQAARGFGVDIEQTRFSQREQDSIDLVSLLFTSLAGTHALPERGRDLLSRLVIAYVRLAFRDELLFMQPEHPARRLLDAVALSCESNDGATPQDRALLQRAEELVDRVVAEYNEDLAVFALAASELEDLLKQQRSRAEVAERRVAEAMHGRERLQHARTEAAAALQSAISGRSLTAEVGQFLSQPWLHHAVQVLLRDGERSSRHTQVVALARTLVALDGAAARGAGGAIASGLVNLEESLVQCAQSSGLDPQLAQEWLAGFARALVFPDATRAPAAVPVVDDDGDEPGAGLRLVGGTDTLAFDPTVASVMRELAVGAWLRLVDDAGKEVSVKLAWISPISGRRLLVDRRGLRQLVASPEQMAILAGEGRLVPNPAATPFEEAMRVVRRQLYAAAG